MRFLIQIVRAKKGEKRPALEDIAELLAGTGVELDPGYGPIAIDPSRGCFVVRGSATPEARSKAEAIPGVTFFADSKIGPT